jgi:hypothetical protein
MTKTEAFSLASGFAWAAEEFSGKPTATPDGTAGDFAFATAYAQRREAFDAPGSGVTMMPSVGHAYANWQRSGGATVDYKA